MENWKNIAKRMVVINQLGMRIEEDSGHRYIIFDDKADFSIEKELIVNDILQEKFCGSVQLIKHYGSYMSALNLIDSWLRTIGEPILLDKFNIMFPNNYDFDRIFNPTDTV